MLDIKNEQKWPLIAGMRAVKGHFFFLYNENHAGGFFLFRNQKIEKIFLKGIDKY